jgi:hypothetical protein
MLFLSSSIEERIKGEESTPLADPAFIPNTPSILSHAYV